MGGNDKQQHVAKITIIVVGILILLGTTFVYLFYASPPLVTKKLPEQPYTGLLFANVYQQIFVQQQHRSVNDKNLTVSPTDPLLSLNMLPEKPLLGSSLNSTRTNLDINEKSNLKKEDKLERGLQKQAKDLLLVKDLDVISKTDLKKDFVSAKFMPTDKKDLLTLAKQMSGKTNPFDTNSSGLAKQGQRGKKLDRPSFDIKFDKLPEIFLPGNLGKNSSTQAGTLQIDMPPAGIGAIPRSDLEKISLSGIVGNSVIVHLEGKNRSLRVGETFNKIRLLSIHGSSATFQEGGDIQVKYLESIR